jgi:eukaryotic-like serine/threonine-protein kinase
MLREGSIVDGKYRVQRLLGRGGMGAVWLAENIRVRRQVAIKVLSRAAAEQAGDALVRFEREAQAAGQIGSDHIVEVLDLGTTGDGDPFMVMELLEGETLKQRMKRGRLDGDKVSAVFQQLLDGLAAAHAAGIVHRDLKPDNVFLQREKAGQRDWVKILDFGISKFSQISGEAGQMTQAGMVMGTPFYMSPEQARTAHAVDARSDLYSVAVMLFETLTGQVPFNGTTFAELLFKIAFEPPPHPKSVMPTLDDRICAIIVKGMERDPAARFQSAAELGAALQAWDAWRAAAGGRVMDAPAAPVLPVPPPTGLAAEDAATRVWMGPTETQRSWNEPIAVASQARKGRGAIIAVAGLIGALAAIGAAALLLRGGGTATASGNASGNATANATATATATGVNSDPEGPRPAATATSKGTANSADSAHVAEVPAASATAKGGAAGKATAVGKGKKPGVVTDYGY